MKIKVMKLRNLYVFILFLITSCQSPPDKKCSCKLGNGYHFIECDINK